MKIKQKLHLARQAAHGASLREWLQDRAAKAAERNAEAAAARQAQPRGVDRVPARYLVDRPAPEVLVEVPRRTRPSRAKSKPGRPLPRLREQRAARLEYATGKALVGRHFVTDEGEQAAIATVRRWTR